MTDTIDTTESAVAGMRPARRFMHVCYSSSAMDPVVQFFTDAFGMKLVMTNTVGWANGAVLGFDRQTKSGAAFVYDARGARTSPALEVQEWADPPLVGEPPTDPLLAGIKAIGVTVPSLDASLGKLAALGCTLIGRDDVASIGPCASVRDPRGVTIDVVQGEPAKGNPSQLRHLRLSVTDLEASLLWLDGLGFDEVARSHLSDGTAFGVEGEVDAELVRLRLPDEPFELLLVEWRTPRTHGRHTDVPNSAGLFRAALGVDDTPAAYEAMRAAGWEFARAPISVPLPGTPLPDLVVCFLDDPDGVPFEFVQRPRSAFR